MATSLSAGLIIRQMLLDSTEVTDITENIFPVVTDEAELPYIAYRRMDLEPRVYKTGNTDTTVFEVMCFASTYEGCVALAEAVRDTLDCKSATLGDLRMRSCVLSGGEETWQDDAFVQRLLFTVRV